jgi:hypothetical protein
MNFSSLKEYFYKLANRSYLLVLLPLAAFIYLFQQLMTKELEPLIQDEPLARIVIVTLGTFALVNLTSVHWIASRRLKKYSLEVGLGRKLDHYNEIVMFRIGASSASSLMMATGLLLTSNEIFGILFLAILLWTLVQWPTARRACRDLQLKGDEYEMVLYKKDKF